LSCGGEVRLELLAKYILLLDEIVCSLEGEKRSFEEGEWEVL
jgi:hypothetical protein